MDNLTTEQMDFFVGHLKTIQAMVTMIDPETVSKMQDAMHRVDTLGPILDPTLYRDRLPIHRLNIECVDAFAAYHKRLLEIAEKVGEQ